MQRKFITKNIMALMFLLITGCSSLQSPQSSLPILTPEIRNAKLAALNTWSIRGAISITNKDTAEIINFTWHQRKDAYLISLSGPLNFGRATIKGNQKQVSLERGPNHISAENAARLCRTELGLELPIENLAYWIKGFPAPKGAVQEYQLDNSNRLIYLKQNHCEIRYRNFIATNSIELPNKIEIFTPNLQLKLIIKKWSVL